MSNKKFYLYEHYNDGFNGWYTNDDLDQEILSNYYYEYDSGNFTFYNANYDNISIVASDKLLIDANEHNSFNGSKQEFKIYKDILTFDYEYNDYFYDSDKIIKIYANNSWNNYANQVHQFASEYETFTEAWCIECHSQILNVGGGYMCKCQTKLTYQEQYETQLMHKWVKDYNFLQNHIKNPSWYGNTINKLIIKSFYDDFVKINQSIENPSNKLIELYYQVTGQQHKLNIIK